MNLTCAIIDDEPLAVKLLENYVQRTPQTELVATYSGAVQAVSGLEEHPVDLIFCDIEMPELSGLQFAQMITDMRSRIVFHHRLFALCTAGMESRRIGLSA